MKKNALVSMGILLAAILLIILSIGGKFYMDQKQFHNEMVNVVKSDEAKKEIERGLKNLDPKALTPEGVIKSYEIDYGTIEHNPMGGIMFDVIVNNDDKLRVYNILDKDTSTGNLENAGGGNTSALEELLTDKEK
ncbi:DUF1310 family protein [Lactococcus ileimucosae]|uniref:DUF1310 family protein n=1 Tax=Lactococcus ileimucosae TaxID=2941329 RepID=UPI0020436CC1|nr:DUF1310 family protein [Lactococcus ileimucosae]